MRYVLLLPLFLLTACGVSDVASTAATGAKIQAEQIKQGKQTMDKMRADLDAAAKTGQERNAAAEEASK